MPIQNPNAVGAAPASGNPQGNPQAPVPPQAKAQLKYGMTPEHVAALRKDPEVIAVVRGVTGRDFPMEQIDDELIVEIAGAVAKLGVQGAIQKAEQILSPEQKATIRGISMKQKVPMAPRGF